MPVPAGSTPPAPPSSGPLYYDPVLSRVRLAVAGPPVTDTFTRAVFPGWGTADSGQTWITTGGAPTDYSTDGTKAAINVATVNVPREASLAVSYADVEITVGHLKATVLPTGANVLMAVRARYVDASNFVEVRLFANTDNTVTINVRQVVGGVEASAGFPVVPGVTATTALAVRVQAVGSTLRARAWDKAGAEPSAWQVTLTVTHFAAGKVAFLTQRSSGNTNGASYFVEVDTFTALPTFRVERSTDQVVWSTVRGGAALTPVADEVRLDDYEFTPDVTNYYRVGALFTGSIVPDLGGVVWLKSLARPYLNRAVTVVDYSDVERPSRTGVFDVVGRSHPVAVNDVRGSRRWTLEVLANTADQADDLDLLLASGDVLLVHVPADKTVPDGYVTVGDSRERRTSRLGARRVFELPCVQVAAPGPDVLGATITCQGVLDMYATCAALLAAHPTCLSVLELIGDPTDVIVS